MKTNLVQGDYKVFNGRYNAQMPLLVQEGFTPLTTKDIMQYRIKAFQSKDKAEIDFWLNQYWDTVDGLAYHNDNLIVVPKTDLLLGITPESKLSNGSLELTPEQYKELSEKNEVIKRSKIEYYKPLTKEKAKQHPIWLKLAQEDKSLLKEYVDLTFARAKEVYNYDENMGIYLPNDQETPLIRAWFLRDLGGGSDAGARGDFGYSLARLFGVSAQNLEEVLGRIAIKGKLTDPRELEKAIRLYKTTKELIQ